MPAPPPPADPRRDAPAGGAPGGDGASATPRPGAPHDVGALRQLILGDRQAALLDRWALDGPDRVDAESLANALPEAVRLRESRDDRLGQALAPTIETGLKASVERNPQPVVDAIFPVIGPAIRRSIQHALASSMQSINQSVNYGLSARGLRWRVEAWRQGLSFGEVVLRHTLAYRVEQVLLVHRRTGLLLHHVVAPEAAGSENPDLVSAMLSAIRQFVEDSFAVDEDDALDALQVGDLSVWIEPGPHAVLAAVVRGHPPEALRTRLCEAIEAIHRRYGEALDAFAGDAAPFDSAGEVLEGLLETEYAEETPAGLSWKTGLLLLAVVGVLAWWGWSTVQHRAAERRYLAALDATPGIETIRTDHEGGQLVVVGVRDPFAPDPALGLAAAGLSAADVDARWIPYTSDAPAIVAARLSEAAAVPAAVTLTVDASGTVRASGTADTAWAARVRALLPLVAGARALDVSAVTTPFDAAAAALERQTLRFESETATLAADSAAVARLRADVRRLAAAAPPGAALEVLGHTDDVGTPWANEALSRRRAQAVAAALADAPGDLPVRLVPRGAEDRLADGVSPASRRVTFRVVRSPPAAP